MKYYHQFNTMHFLEHRKCPECKNDITLTECATSEWGTAKFECSKCDCKYDLLMNGWYGFGSMANKYSITIPKLINNSIDGIDNTFNK